MSIYDPIRCSDLSVFWDCAKGRTGWVLGGGRSLLETKAEHFSRGDFVIAVNHQILCRRLLRFPAPDIWLFGDMWVPMNIPPGGYPEIPKWVSNGAAAAYLYGAGYHRADTKVGDRGRGPTFVLFGENDYPMIKRCEKFTLKTFNRTIHAALHAAWMVGCNPINLVGVGGPRGYWWEGMGRLPDIPKEIADGYDASHEKARDDTATMLECIRADGVEVRVLSEEAVHAG
ncbi:MAG: hypothetical protein AMS14_10855 [Planctomycetes bacterium DG_20]|nr:MAG: hypothetical protein AMS14_10855 [Planctomycetes bacterium DG_20]